MHRRPKNFSPHPKRSYNMKLYFRSLFCCVWTPADSLAVCSACCQLSIPNKNTPGTMEPTAAQTKKKIYVTSPTHHTNCLVFPQNIWRSALACTPQLPSVTCNQYSDGALSTMPATVRSQKATVYRRRPPHSENFFFYNLHSSRHT